MGQTIDDAIGEAIDKVARNLSSDWSISGGLGKSLESLAEKGNVLPHKSSCLDHIDNPLNFSFSGLKTSLNDFIRNNSTEKLEDLAATVQTSLFDHLLDRTELCLKILTSAGITIKQMSLIGGVACNQYFKRRVLDIIHNMDIELIVPPPEICTDNAVMIGLAALSVMKSNNFVYMKNRPDQDWNVEELSVFKSMLE